MQVHISFLIKIHQIILETYTLREPKQTSHFRFILCTQSKKHVRMLLETRITEREGGTRTILFRKQDVFTCVCKNPIPVTAPQQPDRFRSNSVWSSTPRECFCTTFVALVKFCSFYGPLSIKEKKVVFDSRHILMNLDIIRACTTYIKKMAFTALT